MPDHDVHSKKTSVEHEPSRTAMATATLRALAAIDEAVRGPDTLAEIFLTEDRRRALKDPAARKLAFFSKIIPGMYEFMIARTAFFDSLFETALHDS
jgi:O-methyltransferase involved in polyketide biosynthesis